jgi:hypothetical protein
MTPNRSSRRHRNATDSAPKPEPRGNFLAEWFGFRVYPSGQVNDSAEARRCQAGQLCPFISAATRQDTACIKAKRKGEEPTGVCTIQSENADTRGDWLACPFRLLDRNFTLLEDAIRTISKVDRNERLSLYPITVLNRPERKAEIIQLLRDGQVRVFLFTANKLGGEVDIPERASSPGGKVDFSVMEVTLTNADPPLNFGKVMMFEIQTADFHGSPKHAVEFLKSVCPKGMTEPYHDQIRANPDDVGRKVEGPNKSNIFKRTIYQMLYKMELARDAACAGFVIVIPLPVWTSWLRHLGMPALAPDQDDPALLRLERPQHEAEEEQPVRPEPAWIFVFDIDRDSKDSPQPLKVVHRVATDAASLMYFAFEEAVNKATGGGVMATYRQNFIGRVKEFWQAAPAENLTEEEGFVPDSNEESTGPETE